MRIPEVFSFTGLGDALSLSTSQGTTNSPVISFSSGIQSKQSRLFIEAGFAKGHAVLMKVEGK